MLSPLPPIIIPIQSIPVCSYIPAIIHPSIVHQCCHALPHNGVHVLKVRNLEPTRHQLLENTLRIILGSSSFQLADVLRAVALERVLALICIVEIGPLLKTAINGSGKLLDFLNPRLDKRVSLLLLLRGLDHGGSKEQNAVRLLALHTHDVATGSNRVLAKDSGEGLEETLGGEGLLRDKSLEVLNELDVELGSLVQDASIVLEGEGEPDVVEVGGDVVFECHLSDGGVLDRVHDLGKSKPLLVSSRLFDTGHVGVESSNNNVLEVGHVGEHGDEVAIGVIGNVVGEGNNGVNGLGSNVLGKEGHAAPHLVGWDGGHGELGDDAEVVGAALEGNKEVGVAGLAGGDNAAVGKDDLIGDDVIAGEATAGSEEGVTAAEQKTGDTNIALTATGNGTLVLDQLRVDIPPAGARADIGSLGSSIVGGGVEEAKIDGDAAGNVVGASPVGVTTGTDGKWLFGGSKSLDGKGHLLGIARSEDRSWTQPCAVGPI